MNSEQEKADILFDYGLPLQFCCHLIQFYTLLFLRVATLTHTCTKLLEKSGFLQECNFSQDGSIIKQKCEIILLGGGGGFKL